MNTITIAYTCHKCGLIAQELSVPKRQRAVDVTLWMKVNAGRAAKDHAERQPFCQWETFDVIVPASEDETMLGRK